MSIYEGFDPSQVPEPFGDRQDPKHTDTSRDLVERLRGDWPEILVEKHWMMDSDAIDKQREEAADRIEALEARVAGLTQERDFHRETADLHADRIEALEAENERLREAVGILEDGLQEVGDDYPGSSCQEWCQHQIKQARAALKEISNGDR